MKKRLPGESSCTLRRLASRCSFRFRKNSSWYWTHYRCRETRPRIARSTSGTATPPGGPWSGSPSGPLAAVFKKSGVKNAHAHRYRHTLATRLLEQGATFEEVADILGNSPDGGSEALRQVVEGAPGQHRPAHDRAFPDGGRYKSSHTAVTRKNGGCKLMKIQELKWCGEGDLNPHEIAPASTSS